MDRRRLLDTALEAARAAVDVHRRHLGQVQVKDWSAKGVADFVTDVDREAERRIVERIRGRYPDHALLAEEAAGDQPDASRGPPQTAGDQTSAPQESGRGAAPATPEWLWIIDPLDGTTNYLHAYPAYSVSVAVLHRGEPVVGVVISGATGEE